MEALSDGVRIYLDEHGEPDAPLTVVLLHGWTLDRRTWHRQITRLPAALGAPVRIIAYDARGHGRSSGTPRRAATLARLADDLAQVLAAVAPQGPLVLAGHSMGGMTIMEYAHRYPDEFAARVRGVVLVSTTAEGALHTTFGLGPRFAWATGIAERTGAGVLSYSGSWCPHVILTPVLRPSMRWLLFGVPALREDVRLTTSAVTSAPLRSIGGFRPSIVAHRRIDALAAFDGLPTAVLVGSRDRLTPVACARSVAAALPNATLTVCEQAGHMLPLERPDEVTDAIATTARQAMVTSGRARRSPRLPRGSARSQTHRSSTRSAPASPTSG